MAINYSKGQPGLVDIIREIDPTAIVIVDDEDVNKIQWLEGTTPIDKAKIISKKTEIDAEWYKNQYQRDRKDDFRQLGIATELDLLWHDINDGKFGADAKTGGFYTTIKALKDKYPKS